MYCKNCGSQIDDDSKFCDKCGQTISKKEEKDNTTSKDTKKSGIELEKEKLEKINKKLRIPYLIIEFVIILALFFGFEMLFVGKYAMEIIIQTTLMCSLVVEFMVLLTRFINKFITKKRISEEKPNVIFMILLVVVIIIGSIWTIRYALDSNYRAKDIKIQNMFNSKEDGLYYKTKDGDTYIKISSDGTKVLQVYFKEDDGKYKSSELSVELFNSGHSKVGGNIIPTLEKTIKKDLKKITESEYNKIKK